MTVGEFRKRLEGAPPNDPIMVVLVDTPTRYVVVAIEGVTWPDAGRGARIHLVHDGT